MKEKRDFDIEVIVYESDIKIVDPCNNTIITVSIITANAYDIGEALMIATEQMNPSANYLISAIIDNTNTQLHIID